MVQIVLGFWGFGFQRCSPLLSFRISGLQVSGFHDLRKRGVLPFGFPGAETSTGSHVSLRWMVLTNSGFRVPRFPHSYATPKGFKPCACSLDLTVVRVLLSSRTYSMALTLHALSSLSLSLWPYTTPAAVSIIPLHLLSFVTQPSDSLTLRNIERSEISPPDTISSQNLGPKTTYLVHPGSALKPWI
jgi:hypothetical protein